ncbi:MAG: hypothetical protein JWQ87_3656 [Candidatus Sulfotelmatobacter sp.]|nr:hypothetical protein [Candidatus Sulfotelmatobacter sp.]
MKVSRRFVLVACTCVIWSLAAHSGETPEPELELKTAAVAAFKNGLAFVVKQGDVRLESGVGNLSSIPNATLGSLWIAPNDAGASLDEVVAHRDKVVGRQNLTALADVLMANAGKVVTVVDNSQKEYTGEIVGFRQGEKSGTETAGTEAADRVVPQLHVVPEFLLLKSDGKLLALYFRNIARAILPENSIFQQTQEEERKALRFRVKGATEHANLTMGYLEHGLGWTPSYLVSLKDDKTAQITMQAVLVNDAEDLKDTDFFFVVGVPNFAYSNIPSPMALQQTLIDFMQAAARKDEMDSRYSNALMGQKAAALMAYEGPASPSFGSVTEELQGVQEEDLFLYSRKNVTLARGERATYNVFSETVNCQHIYEWNLEDQPRVDGFGNAQNNANSASDRSMKDNVWHSLRLKNTTKFPWTSAPTMVISGTRPLSQDTVPYTPKNASSNLKLTIATDIRASHEENEVERQKEIQRRRNYNYDQVTVEGKLTIKNYKSKEVRLSIANKVRGTVESQTDEGKADKLAEAIAVDNPLTRMTWEVSLKAGEERVIKYRYKVWLRV